MRQNQSFTFAQTRRPSNPAAIILVMLAAVCPSLHAQPKAEPGTLRTSDFLPAELLKGGSYSVADTARNDGLINTYQVTTKYGPVTVESTSLLRKRLHELRALEQMEQLKKSDLYLAALKRSAAAPVETAKGLVTAPVETTKGVVTGVGRWLHDAGSTITSKEPKSDTVVERVSGHSQAKRQFAFEYGVDPYSPYPPLQKTLDDIAWASASGSMTVSAALAVVPGGVGTLAVTTKTAGDMKNLVREQSPTELNRLNTQKLTTMGVPANLTQYFLANQAYGAEEQTILVGELDSLGGVKDRGLFVQKAAGAADEPTAIFNRTQAQMFAAYHARVGKVTKCIDAAGVVLLEKEDGSVVGLFPVDHVVWTPEVSQKAESITAAIKDRAGKGKLEFWFLGTVDKAAQDGLTAAGWKVTPKAGERLFARQ